MSATVFFPGFAAALHLHDDGDRAEARLRAAVQADEEARYGPLVPAPAVASQALVVLLPEPSPEDLAALDDLLAKANAQGPCGGECASCPVLCGPDAPDVDPMEVRYVRGDQ